MPRQTPQFHFHWRQFSALSVNELYSLMRLRQQVFVVEQECAYLDADNLDIEALHLLCLKENNDHLQLVGCLRLLPPGARFKCPAIGRLATVEAVRGQGVARLMMEQAIQHTSLIYPGQAICLSAQCYLEGFYHRLGFIPTSPPYDEDGIPHIDMMRQPDSSSQS